EQSTTPHLDELRLVEEGHLEPPLRTEAGRDLSQLLGVQVAVGRVGQVAGERGGGGEDLPAPGAPLERRDLVRSADQRQRGQCSPFGLAPENVVPVPGQQHALHRRLCRILRGEAVRQYTQRER